MIEVVCVVYDSLHYTNQYALTRWNKQKYKHKKILLVTHGGICRSIYWYFNGIPKDGNSSSVNENCKIYEYEL